MNNIFYIVIIFLLIIILINMLPSNNHRYYESKQYTEGFTIPGLNDMTNTINKLGSIANSIPNEINNIKSDIDNTANNIQNIGNTITSQIDGKLNNFTSKVNTLVTTQIDGKLNNVINQVEDLVTNKIKKFFTQLGDVLNNGIVKPIIALFEGIGYIFVAIFDILKQIVNKLISLPGCMFIYMVNSIFETMYYIYSSIIPNFIRKPIDYMFTIFIKTPIGYILTLFGISSISNKCYSFNVDDSIDKMNNQLSNINKAFKKDFGRLDFSSITI